MHVRHRRGDGAQPSRRHRDRLAGHGAVWLRPAARRLQPHHTDGISAVGVAVLDVFGRPIAISIPAPSQRFESERDSHSQALGALRDKMRSLLGR
jgi:DNA-binding IclR family transcriptional regulator